MTRSEFIRRLDPSNPSFVSMCYSLGSLSEGEIVIVPKSNDFVEVVEGFLAVGMPPLADKRLQVVIGGVAHGWLRTILFHYHKGRSRDEVGSIEQDAADADAYTKQGMGYHFSSMGGNLPIVGDAYRPDRFDKDLFRMLGLGRYA